MTESLSDDAARMYLAELFLFGEAPIPVSLLEPFVARFESESALLADITPMIDWWKATYRYHLHAAGLPRMEPPSLDDIGRIVNELRRAHSSPLN